MRFYLVAIVSYAVFGVNLPPCPHDPVCPALVDNRAHPPYDPFDDIDFALQYVNQYDCSNLNLKKRGLSCFGLLPKVLTEQQKKTIIQHGQALGYYISFLNAASDDRLRLINTEFDKYNKYLKKNFQQNSKEEKMFIDFYKSIRSPLAGEDETTLDFESIRDRTLAKIAVAEKLSEDLLLQIDSSAFQVVPEAMLKQMAQVGSQLLHQQSIPRLFFLNVNDARRRIYYLTIMDTAMQYVLRALTKLKNGHPCHFLPCSDPNHLPVIIKMFENVLNHPRFNIFQRPDPKLQVGAVTTYNLRNKGIIAIMEGLLTDSYEYQIKTFIHETTHLYGTKDYQYKVPDCMALLRDNPLQALNNADSYALEIINMGRETCNIQSPRPI